MRLIPVDAEAFASKVLSVVEVVPDADFTTGEQKRSADGMPVWKVRLLTRDGDDPARRPELTEVKLPAVRAPEVEAGVIPRFGGLVGIVWSGENGGGVSLRAESISTSNAPSVARAAKSDKPAA